ncbi:MAG: rubrerythrin family protein, partial [candidate division KSB1 bacterium]|nr:rubrerythrin family protein [candidate division KSB1 bacterium]
MEIDQRLIDQILIFQRNEITEHHIYRRLAARIKSPANKQVLQKIADDELRHYQRWRHYSQTDVKPNSWRVWLYYWVSRIFGLTFGIKLLERVEKSAEH